MRVLIIGASGFVGRHLVRECLARGDEVVATRRPDEPEEDGSAGDRPVDWRPLELLEDGALEKLLASARPGGIVHLAGQAHVASAERDPVGTWRVNAEGPLRLLAAQRDRAPSARTVVVTSAEVYGAVPPEELPVAEDRPLEPRTAYGVTKAAADFAAERAAAVWGLSVVRMRPFNHIGPGQRPGFVAPDFARQVAAIERGEAPAELAVGNLSARRDFTDVRDVVRGYRDALEQGRPGRAYNLCSGCSVAIEDLVRFFVERARVAIRVIRDEARLRPVDVPEFRGDASAARRDLGWEPRIPLERSLADVLEEWRRPGAGPGGAAGVEAGPAASRPDGPAAN